jgi:hypothetical protein
LNPGLGLIRRWRQLPPDEQQDLWPAGWRLLLVWLLLGSIGLRRTGRLLGGNGRRPAAASVDVAAWRRRALALRRVGGRLPGARCLARALCLHWWMQREGIAAVMKMGVERDHGGASLAGHAWVEWNGEPIDDSREAVARFQPLRWH